MIEMAIVVSMLNGPLIDPEIEMEHHCLIENAIYEAMGEGPKGMRLVTEVVLNRYESGYRSNDTLCGAVYYNGQFSWTSIPEENRRKYTEEEYLKAAQVVFSVIYDEVDTILPEDVRHYLNKEEAGDQSWYRKDSVVYEWKNHTFLKVK